MHSKYYASTINAILRAQFNQSFNVSYPAQLRTDHIRVRVFSVYVPTPEGRANELAYFHQNRKLSTLQSAWVMKKLRAFFSSNLKYLVSFKMICTGDFLTICLRQETFLGHYVNLRKILSQIGPMAYLVFKKQTRFIEIKEVHLGHR